MNDEAGVKVYSKETCYLIADILSKLNRNDLLVDVDYSKLPKFAWKTGTSYGKRDAWAVGFNPNYTIVAWVGNFSGKGSPFLSGAASALPLLADLFNAIDYNSKIKWFNKPQDIISREVCSVSGLLPTDDCKEHITELAIKNRSHNNYCDIHQEIIVSNDESVQYCKECLPDSNYKKKVYTIFNPDLVSYYKSNNIGYDSIPKHNPNCSLLKLGEGPKITSPSENFEYYIDRNELQEIVLSTASDPKVKYEYWYVNDKLISRCKPGEKVFYKFSFGKSKIVCMDDLGRSKKITINVKGY